MIVNEYNTNNIHNILNHINTQGVLIIHNYIDKDKLDNLLKIHYRIEGNLINSKGLEKSDLEPGYMARYRKGTNPNLKNIDNIFSAEWMRKLSTEYFANRVNLNSEIFIGLDQPGTNHIAQDLHFDIIPTLKFFLYLNDVTESNGAFSCVPKSHTLTKDIRSKHKGIDFDSREITREHNFAEDEIIPVEASAGSLIIFTTEVWHKAGKVANGERRIMRGHTRPSSGFLDRLKNLSIFR